MTIDIRQTLRRTGGAAAVAALLIAPAGALAQPMPSMQQPAGQGRATTGLDPAQRAVLSGEVVQLRARLAQIEAALGQGHQGGAARAGKKPGMAMSDEMGMGGAMGGKAMAASAGCCADAMGKMAGMGMGKMPAAMPSDLPGFPGASHLYHVGATGFFLDHPEVIKLAAGQEAALNRIKERSLAEQAAAQRKADQAEQDL